MKSRMPISKIWKQMISLCIFVVSFLMFLILPINQVFAWGPERETFYWDTAAPYRTINSIIDNPSLGDERNFVRVREVGDAKFGNEVVAEIGKEYEVQIYFHNNASSSLNASGEGIADGVRVNTILPSFIAAGEKGEISGAIMAANTIPESVWDEAHIKTDKDVYIKFVDRSTMLHSNGTIDGMEVGQKQLFSYEGTNIGFWDDAWGILPGCNEYAGYVSYKFIVVEPAFEISSFVKKVAFEDWKDSSLHVSSGERVWVALMCQNIELPRFQVSSILPIGLTYVHNTTCIVNDKYPNGLRLDEGITTDKGISIPSELLSLSENRIIFEVEVGDSPFSEYNIQSFISSDGSTIQEVKTTMILEEVSPKRMAGIFSFFKMDNPIIYVPIFCVTIFLEEVIRRELKKRTKEKAKKK